ncbi:hypothetical protein GCM10009665_40890 [Kitasatospora nipponensis]|uniref:non-specific serine/threonine protein kinase n=1 Tax=Kitasatospora nipponensis TaxID=258049 RepID=A0ABN1WEW0_9ACTN
MSGQQSLADGRYVLESKPIGTGGMGSVWRGYDQKLHRTVAVKALHLPDGLNAEEQARLRARAMREARAIARLEHPGIVAVHDVLEEDGQPWIVMRFIAGRTLDQEVQANGPLSPQRAAEVGTQLVNALSAAHGEGVLHLDVKPQNVLLNDKGQPVLTDFGIASVAGATAPQTTALLGTVGYVAPERLAGAEPGPAADLWSLGATLYFAVEGRPAYAADNVAAALAAVMTRDPQPMTRAGVLAPTIAGLLTRDPGLRLDAAGADAGLRDAAATAEIVPLGERPRTKALPTEVRDPPGRSVLSRRTAVAVVAPLLLAAVAIFPYALSQSRGTAGRQPGSASSPTTPSTTPSASPTPSLSPTPSASPTQAVTVRYQSIPEICDKVGSRSSTIIPDMDTGTEDGTAPGAILFAGISESHGCRWSTEGYWYEHPWAADVEVTMFRFSSGAYGSAAFEKERTDSFYGNALRLHGFADDLCISNPTGKDYGYAHVMFRIDNLLVQVSYEMQTAGSPAPAVARPRGLDMAKYVYEVLAANP